MLPKFKALPWPGRPDGGRPPLAAGCGIGDGEVAGDEMRGLVVPTGNEDCWLGWGTDPNWMLLGLLVGPAAVLPLDI